MSPSFEPSIPSIPIKRKIGNAKNLTIRNITGQIIEDNTQGLCVSTIAASSVINRKKCLIEFICKTTFAFSRGSLMHIMFGCIGEDIIK